MLENTLNNLALNDAEKRTVQQQAQTKGIGAALGLLGGLLQAARERYRAMDAKIERMEAEEERRWQQARLQPCLRHGEVEAKRICTAFDLLPWRAHLRHTPFPTQAKVCACPACQTRPVEHGQDRSDQLVEQTDLAVPEACCACHTHTCFPAQTETR